MKGYVTGQTVANDIRMSRSQHSGPFLIVEGDCDARLYKRFLDTSSCAIINAVEKDKFDGVLAIVDADFWNLEGFSSTSSNLLLTDTHDLDTMILNSPALEVVLTEYGSQNKLQRLPNDIRELLLESGKVLGYLQWISLKDNLGLKFEDLSFSKFVNRSDLSTNVKTMIKVVCDHSKRPDLKTELLQSRINEISEDNHDLWQVCCGHHLISILSIGLCKLLGSCNSGEARTENIETALRLAYDSSFFTSTKLFAAIKEWGGNNKRFRVLP